MKTKSPHNGVDYYNIDNESITKDNRENIVNDFSLLTEADASLNLRSSQEVAKPKTTSETQAPTPQLPSDTTVKRMVSQIFYNDTSTQKHKIKVRLNHTDGTSTEWIATMSKDARIFRKHNNLELARDFIASARRQFSPEQGYKKPYLGKFHLHKDTLGVTQGIQKEPGCYASMAYNTQDESWYAIIVIYDFMQVVEYDYNYTQRQKSQGVRAQLVWTNPQVYAHTAPQTYAQRNGISIV